jgi:hypothetical protein
MTGAVVAFTLTGQMILVLSWNWVIKDDPPASSTWVRQLFSYVRILEIGCVLRAGIGITVGVLTGSATKRNGDRRLSGRWEWAGRWDWAGVASSAELMSNTTLRSDATLRLS